jgi:hypothetical protein
MSDVTRILSAVEQGDPHAASQLLPLVYDELRRLAAQKLAHEKPGQTLSATALVHEAYPRLVGIQWAERERQQLQQESEVVSTRLDALESALKDLRLTPNEVPDDLLEELESLSKQEAERRDRLKTVEERLDWLVDESATSLEMVKSALRRKSHGDPPEAIEGHPDATCAILCNLFCHERTEVSR